MIDLERNYERVALEKLVVEMALGVFPHEYGRVQPVEVNVEMWRQSDGYKGGGLDACLNYDAVFTYLTVEWPKRPHTPLLEELADDLLTFCMQDRRVDRCRVVLRKLEVYAGRAIPVLEQTRNRVRP